MVCSLGVYISACSRLTGIPVSIQAYIVYAHVDCTVRRRVYVFCVDSQGGFNAKKSQVTSSKAYFNA